MQNHQRKVYVTQLHKLYSELNQALVMYLNDRNAVNLLEAGLNSASAFNPFFKKYFKVVQDCGDEQTPCFAENYIKLSGDATSFQCRNNCVLLADGIAIGTDNILRDKSQIVQISIDINGPQGPNILGRDAFCMFIY